MNSRPPDDRPVLFIDRNLGRYVLADKLREAGIPREVYDDHLLQDATDGTRLQFIGAKGWIAIGRDKNIRYRGPEKPALIQANACFIVVRTKNTTGPDIADLIIKQHTCGDLQQRAATPVPGTPDTVYFGSADQRWAA